MTKMRILVGMIGVVALISSIGIHCNAQEPLDGQSRILHDTLLENLSGNWKLTRSMKGQTSENSATAEWVLNHQFLRLHMKDEKSPAGYEAIVFIGYDKTSERYVAHWIDVFGGRVSETLGYGIRQDNTIKFVFEYPDGPFMNTMTWNNESKSWTFVMQQKNASGAWVDFASDVLHRH